MVARRLMAAVSEAAGGGWASVKVAARSGLVTPVRPDRLLGAGLAFRQWGMSPATAYAVGAALEPARLAVIDERESVSYAEMDRRSTLVAATLAELGVGVGDAVALLARNSAAFLVAQAAICKLGADVLYVNTGFAGPQLGDVLTREKAAAVVVDDEFAGIVDQHAGSLPRMTAWVEDGSTPPESIAGVVGAASGGCVPSLSRPGRDSRHVILTSGTTGTPKGAARGAPGLLAGALEGVSVAEAIPYRGRGVTVLAAPAFHAWGLANMIVGTLMRSTLVVTRRFDPAVALRLVERHRADTLVAVPVMAQRMLAVEDTPDTSTLRVVALSGSAIPASVATQFMDRFGDVVYSLYGSTEVAYVSVAGPRDLREAPTSAGRVLRGVEIRLVDDEDRDVPPGGCGRIFAGNAMAFEGYTNGEDKARLGALTSTGDMGRIGEDGRLYVEGRDDDMIVSGGENVFPAEVEETLLQHSAVADASVVGVDDEQFGQALAAHVVLRKGSSADEKELRAHVKSHLAGYKVPRTVTIHDELPRNETGKVLKRELRAQPPV